MFNKELKKRIKFLESRIDSFVLYTEKIHNIFNLSIDMLSSEVNSLKNKFDQFNLEAARNIINQECIDQARSQLGLPPIPIECTCKKQKLLNDVSIKHGYLPEAIKCECKN